MTDSLSAGGTTGTDCGINHALLAGGDLNKLTDKETSLKGLPKFQEPLSQRITQYNLSFKQERESCICRSIVLGILAAIAIAGGATLIAYSGVPASFNLHILIPGALLGATGLGLAIGLIVVIVKTVQEQKKQQKEIEKMGREAVSNETALDEMQNAEPDQIASAMQRFPKETSQKFITWVHEQYFAQGAQPLTEEKIKVLKAFATLPVDTLASLDIKNAHPEFIRHLLANLNPDLFVQEGQAVPFIVILFERVINNPLTPEMLKALACHPRALALLVQARPGVYTPDRVASIYGAMEPEQKTAFLQQMADDLKKCQEAGQKDSIHAAVAPCIDKTLTAEFAAQFDPAATDQPQESIAK
jgi:hypothetical protein